MYADYLITLINYESLSTSLVRLRVTYEENLDGSENKY